VTDGMSDAENPVFDKNGKYLYFTASTNSGAAMQQDVESFARPVTASVYVVVLAKSEASPLAPESDDEKKKDDAKKDDAKKDDKDKDKSAEKVEVKVDLERIGQRVLALPMPALRYVGLEAGKAGVVYAIERPAFSPQAPPVFTVHRFDLSKRKTDVVIGGVKQFPGVVHGRERCSTSRTTSGPSPTRLPCPIAPMGRRRSRGTKRRSRPRIWK
jgi:tricorn protease